MAFPLELKKIPQADVYISKLYPNINFNGGSLLRCGRYYTQQNIYRTLMYFDISSFPSNIFIDKAILKLYIKINIFNNIIKPITIHNLIQPFDKDTVTYSDEPLFEDNPYKTLNINEEIDQFVEVDIKDLLIKWYNSPILNYGMIMKGLETENSYVAFSSTFEVMILNFLV